MGRLDEILAAERARRGMPPEVDSKVRARFAFASTLLALRQASGLSQRDLADRTGVPQSEISRIERALTVPTVVRAQALLEPLGWRLTPAPVADMDAANEPELVAAR